MRFYDAGDIRLHLPWPRMLAALEDALRGDVNAPLRVNHAIEVPGKQPASLLLMPAWRAGRRIGVKLVTVFPGNAERGRRSVAAIYAMFDANDGTPLAVFDGEELTARRTAGASAYASSSSSSSWKACRSRSSTTSPSARISRCVLGPGLPFGSARYQA